MVKLGTERRGILMVGLGSEKPKDKMCNGLLVDHVQNRVYEGMEHASAYGSGKGKRSGSSRARGL